MKSLLLLVGVALTGALALWYFNQAPSNSRDWSVDQSRLPDIEIGNEMIRISGIRNFNYTTENNYHPSYYDKEFHFNEIKQVWYIVELLDDAWRGPAHTMLSFEFSGANFLSVSVEIRKEIGEQYSPLAGIFRNYELMYVIADEQDALKLRTNFRKNPVYLYPTTATPNEAKALFIDVMKRAKKLIHEPEFYNTFTNSCSTNIANHVRKIAPTALPRSFRVLLPGYSDELAYEMGLLDRSHSLNELRKINLVTPHAIKLRSNNNYSVFIRRASERPGKSPRELDVKP